MTEKTWTTTADDWDGEWRVESKPPAFQLSRKKSYYLTSPYKASKSPQWIGFLFAMAFMGLRLIGILIWIGFLISLLPVIAIAFFLQATGVFDDNRERADTSWLYR